MIRRRRRIGMTMMMKIMTFIEMLNRRSKKAAPREGGRASMAAESGKRYMMIFIFCRQTLLCKLYVHSYDYWTGGDKGKIPPSQWKQDNDSRSLFSDAPIAPG